MRNRKDGVSVLIAERPQHLRHSMLVRLAYVRKTFIQDDEWRQAELLDHHDSEEETDDVCQTAAEGLEDIALDHETIFASLLYLELVDVAAFALFLLNYETQVSSVSEDLMKSSSHNLLDLPDPICADCRYGSVNESLNLDQFDLVLLKLLNLPMESSNVPVLEENLSSKMIVPTSYSGQTSYQDSVHADSPCNG